MSWTAICLAVGSIAAWNWLSGMQAGAVWSAADRPQVLLVSAQHPLPEDYTPGEPVNLYEQKRRAVEMENAAVQSPDRTLYHN